MSEETTILYKYVSWENLEKIIDQQRLLLGDGSDYNDPFEVSITNRTTKQISHVKGLHILCLTGGFQNKLIWSHYTDSHKGACLTVQIPKSRVYPVCYTSKRVYDDSDIDSLIEKSTKVVKQKLDKSFISLSKKKKIAYLKDKKWIYEKEYRLVFDENDEDLLIHEGDKWYFHVKITNIYLGTNFDKNEREIRDKILAACKRNNTKITRMALSKANYAVVVHKQI